MHLVNVFPVSLLSFPSVLQLITFSPHFPLAANPSDRIDTPVRYFLIDLGSSTRFQKRRLVNFRHGWHKGIPEIYEMDAEGSRVPTKLYDPFKGDVFVLGMILEGFFGKVSVHLFPLTSTSRDETSSVANIHSFPLSVDPFTSITILIHAKRLSSSSTDSL